VISLVVGLGNIGREYAQTRHNVGFDVVSRVAQILNARPLPERSHFESAEATLPGVGRVVLAWPTTYMNRCGLAVVELLEELPVGPGQMLVVLDDVNLPLGTLRFRPGGSDGGHHGLQSIIGQLGTEEFPRLRLGIGRPADNPDVTDFVLSRFLPEEAEPAKRMVALAAEAVIFAVRHRLEEAMSKYNGSPALPDEE
jgi:PTH1 family peptidyl-tRNA hydrolase